MGGIGKITLARKVYEDRCIKDYFHVRAWATISKDCNTDIHRRASSLSIWDIRERGTFGRGERRCIGCQIYKHLFGKRYLVILDDMWEVEAWMKIRTLPDNEGSGIVITTRESKVASIGSYKFGMDLLDEGKSWDLFCKKVFGQDSCCPLELEAVGKRISNNCRGLPLSIAVIGGHLKKSPRMQEYWQYIAENLSSVVNLEVTHKLVSLRYIVFSPPKEGSRIFVIPPSICLLWNLQILVIDDSGEIIAPPEIWKMPHLREISVFSSAISLPRPGPIEDNSDILKSLHTVETMSNFSFCEEVVNRIPNIKKLKVEYDDKREGFEEGAYTLSNVARLEKLETFYCSLFFGKSIVAQRDMLRDLHLPLSLKELSIGHLNWEDVTTKIGSLPLLEVLELSFCSGSEWELVEGQFSQLRILKLYRCFNLEYFRADISHFPMSARAVLRRYETLERDIFGYQRYTKA